MMRMTTRLSLLALLACACTSGADDTDENGGVAGGGSHNQDSDAAAGDDGDGGGRGGAGGAGGTGGSTNQGASDAGMLADAQSHDSSDAEADADTQSDAETTGGEGLNALAEGPWNLSSASACGFTWGDGATGVPTAQSETDFSLELAWNPPVGSAPTLSCSMGQGSAFTCETAESVVMVGNCAVNGVLSNISGTLQVFLESEDLPAVRVVSIGGTYSRSATGTNNPPCSTLYDCAEATVNATGTIGEDLVFPNP